MARAPTGRTLQQRAAELRALDPSAPDAVAKLRTALQSTTGFLVAAAAEVVAEHHVIALLGELGEAFARLHEEGAKRDPGCRGKVALARALHALDEWDERVFVVGLRVKQEEGWGREDTAAELRGICGLAHAQLGRPDALDVIAELMVDPQRVTRVAAAQAAGDTGRPDAAALLRLKVLTGDAEAEVLAACVESMLSLARDASHAFLTRLLGEHDERAEVAALALGGARLADAFDAIRGWCIVAPAEQRHRVGYLALALLRSDEANAYLLGAIRDHGKLDAVAAASALATFKDDTALRALARDAAAQHKDRATRDQLVAMFG